MQFERIAGIYYRPLHAVDGSNEANWTEIREE